MNINRHNYETFFLLYIDNELSAGEENAVDVFVLANPDLHEELTLLQQSVLKPGDISFADKQDLLKEEEISLLQENLLLYIDNELNRVAKQQVEKRITTDKKAYKEFNLLRQTKLEAPALVFADKQSLYRKEGARVINIRWWRVAAAAILLGFGLWTGLSVYKRYLITPAGTGEIVKGDNMQPGQNKTAETDTKPLVRVLPSKHDSISQALTATVKQPDAAHPITADPVTQKNHIQNSTKEEVAAVDKKPSNNLPKSYLENINNKERNETAFTSVPQKNGNGSSNISGDNNAATQNSSKEKTENTASPDINTNGADAKNTAAIPASYNPDAAGNSKDRFLNLDEEKAKHSKVGGFFRKVKRVLERTANIKTGDEVKVAGFAIAIK